MHISFWHPARLISTFFGVGNIPIIPGTFGSVAAYPVMILITILWLKTDHDLISLNSIYYYLTIISILFIVGVIAANSYTKKTNKIDPSEVVIDEVVGQMLVLYLLIGDCAEGYMLIKNHLWVQIPAWFEAIFYLIPLVLFRIFDIIKPWPIKWCDENIKGGFGIMFDDLLAAIMASVVGKAIFIAFVDNMARVIK